MQLIYTKSGTPVYIGDIVKLSRGEEFEIKALIKPHKPESTGRVSGRMSGATYDSEYFPNVIGAEWIDREDR